MTKARCIFSLKKDSFLQAIYKVDKVDWLLSLAHFLRLRCLACAAPETTNKFPLRN